MTHILARTAVRLNLIPSDKLCPKCHIKVNNLPHPRWPGPQERSEPTEEMESEIGETAVLEDPERPESISASLLAVRYKLPSLINVPSERASVCPKEVSSHRKTLQAKLESSLKVTLHDVSLKEDLSGDYKTLLCELRSKLQKERFRSKKVAIQTAGPAS